MANSLFIFGKPAKGNLFTDREKETRRLVSNFKNGINTFIVSPRRWGKTSLVLRAMEEAHADKLKFVFVDVYKCKSSSEFCEKLASAIIAQTSTKIEEAVENAKNLLNRITMNFGISPSPLNPFDITFGLRDKEFDEEEILRLPELIAKKQGIDIVICIDEFQQIAKFNNTEFFQKELRTIWQHQDKVTYCLFGSRKHMMEGLFDTEEKPFYKFADILYLDCIPQSYWTKYIQGKFESQGKTINEKLCEKICESVAFNSSYIQQLSWYLFLECDTVPDDNDFVLAMDELITQNAPVFEEMTNEMTGYQMNFLKAVANGISTGLSKADIVSKYKLGSSANVAAIQKIMIAKDLVTETGQGLVITDKVFEKWLLL